MAGLGGVFKALSAVAFYFAWKFYELPNQGSNMQSRNSLVSEVELDSGETQKGQGRKDIPLTDMSTIPGHKNGSPSLGVAPNVQPSVEV